MAGGVGATFVASLERTLARLDADVRRVEAESKAAPERGTRGAVPARAVPVLGAWDEQIRAVEAEAAGLQARVQARPTLTALLDECTRFQRRLDEYQAVLAKAGIPSAEAAKAAEAAAAPPDAAETPAASDPHTPARQPGNGADTAGSPGRTPLSDVNRTPSLSAFGISSTTLEVLQNKGRDQSVQRVVEALTETEDVLDAQLNSLSEQLQLTSRTATVDRRGGTGVHSTAVPAGLVGTRLVLS